MRLKTSLMTLVLVACGAWAQSPATPQKKAPEPSKKATRAKPAAKKATQLKPAAAAKKAPGTKPATPSNKAHRTRPAVPRAARQRPAAAPIKKAAPPAQVKSTQPRRAKKPVQRKTAVPKPAPAKAPENKASASNAASAKPAVKKDVRRDPFVSPIVTATEGDAPRCQLGRGCLSIGEIVIKGTAKSEDGMLVLVENAANKVYILHENDPVFNGYVAKITMDGVVFRENVMDELGHTSTREVIKKIPTTPGQA